MITLQQFAVLLALVTLLTGVATLRELTDQRLPPWSLILANGVLCVMQFATLYLVLR